jgi:hypothetical protein
MPTRSHIFDNHSNGCSILTTATCGVHQLLKFCYGGLEACLGPDSEIPLLSLLMQLVLFILT